MRLLPIVLLFLGCACAPRPPLPSRVENTERDALVRIASSTVMIRVVYVDKQGKKHGVIGSGVAIAHLKYGTVILTANHVIDNRGVSRISVVYDTDKTTTGLVFKNDEELDLALVLVPVQLPTLALAKKPPPIYSRLLTVSSADGWYNSISYGYYTGIQDTDLSKRSLFKVSGAIFYPGASGGPVLNEHGQIVGIVDACDIQEIAEETDPIPIPQLGLAITLSSIQAFLGKH